jgi:hypothetical protein
MPTARAASAWFLSASKAAMAASFFCPNLLPCPFWNLDSRNLIAGELLQAAAQMQN